MVITTKTIGGKTVYVIIAEPNTAKGTDITVAYETSLDESRGGVGSRRPLQAVPRLTIAYDFIANAADLYLLRNFFGTLKNEKVLIPIWPDLTGRGTRLFTAQVNVGWTPGVADPYEDLEIGEGGSVPVQDVTAPAIIGRIKRVDAKYLSGNLQTVRISVAEESPWNQRVDIAAADPGAFTWIPDRTEKPVEVTRDRLDYERIGQNREQSESGDSNVVTWKQQAGFNLARADLRNFLGFFKGRRGGYEAFEFDSFFQPGASTPQAPHTFDTVRFADDFLKIRFPTSARGIFQAEFEQVLDDTTEQHPAAAALFEIYSDADPAGIARLTDAEFPITAAGQTWTPARIELTKWRSSMKVQNDTCEVRLHIADVTLLAPILRHETDTPVRVKIYDANLSTDPATVTVLTDGTAQDWQPKGPRMTFAVKPFDLLERKLPRYNMSRTCNYACFDNGCGLDAEDFKVTGIMNAQFNTNVLRIVSLGTLPAGMANNWFAGGWVQIGTGIDRLVRLVRQSWYYPSGDGWDDAYGATPVMHLQLDRPARLDIIAPPDSVEMFAGCDGSYGTCVSKFSNGARFGGAPFAPAYISVKPKSMSVGGK